MNHSRLTPAFPFFALMSIVHLLCNFTMGFRNQSLDSAQSDITKGALSDVLDRNLATTAAVTLAAGSGGLVGGICIAAFPAQTLAVGATIGGLAYVGDRQFKGLPINPFEGKEDKKSDEKTTAPAAA